MAKSKKEVEQDSNEVVDSPEEETDGNSEDLVVNSDSVTVKVLDCFIGDKGPGENVDLPEGAAKYYESIGYVEFNNKSEDRD